MDDAGPVRGCHTPAGLHHEVGRACNRQAPAAIEERAQALAGQVLHDHERRTVLGDAEIDGGRHVLAFEGARGLGLALEPGQALALRGQVGVQ